MKAVSITILCTILSGNLLFSQGRLEADFGGGLFEALSLKVKYGKNFQLGICQGFLSGSYWMTGVEGYYHYSGLSAHTNQRTNYIMVGMASTVFAKGYHKYEKIVIYPRIGKSFYFSKRTGINADVGLGLLMSDDIDGYHSIVLPSCGIHFFIRI
jgi:hypothetical protein